MNISKYLNTFSFVLQLVRRDIAQMYRTSYLGFLWSILGPLCMLTIYFLVFGLIFKGRYGAEAGQSKFDYAFTLFTSLNVFAFFSNSISSALGMFAGRPNYITQVVFPLGLLPFTVLGVELFNLAIAMTLVGIFYVVLYGIPPITALLIPIHMAPLALTALGLTYLVGSLAVFARDVQKLVPHILMALTFGSAVFFPFSMAPENLRFLLYYNPMAVSVENVRGVLNLGPPPSLELLAINTCIGLAIAIGGYMFYRWSRPMFADFI